MDSMGEVLQKVPPGYVTQFCTQTEIFGPQSGQNGYFHFPQKPIFALIWVQKSEKWGPPVAFRVLRAPFTPIWFAETTSVETGPQNSPNSPILAIFRLVFGHLGMIFPQASDPKCHLLAKMWGLNISNWVSSWQKNPETKNVPLN